MPKKYRYELRTYVDGLLAYETQGEDDTIEGITADLLSVVEDAIADLESDDE